MAGTFMRRTSDLMRRVGSGKIEASVRVDQVYAQMQHQRKDFRHSRGRAGFLRDPLMTHFTTYYGWVARDLYNEKMTRIFKDIAEDLNAHVKNDAPAFEFDLAYSGEARVKESGRFVYRGPHEPRLSRAQTKAKTRRWNATHPGRSH